MTMIEFKSTLNSEITKLEWIDHSKVYDYFKDDISLNIFKSIMPIFFKKYPSPLDWLNDDLKKDITRKDSTSKYASNTTNSLIYILFWVYETDVLQTKQYRHIILNYLKDKFSSPYIVNFTLYKGLISKKDLNKIKSFTYVKSYLSGLCLTCICFQKKIRNITDKDMDEFYKYNIVKKTRIQNLRLELGLSDIVPRVERPSPNWDILCKHSKFGTIFKEYKKFIKTAHYSSNKKTCDRYMASVGTALKHLVNFLDEYGYKDFSIFESPSIYEELIEYIEEFMKPQSVTKYIPKVRTFINNHIKEEFFPKKKSFCSQFWSSYSRNAKKLTSMSDGLSFSDPKLAIDIVRRVLEYEPQNEVELLAKHFWLIISSCPARFSYILDLEAYDAIKPLPNSCKEAYGVYSSFADKAGTKYGQYPILDKIGVNAIKTLQDRVKNLNLKPLYNYDKKCSYVHLFQLTKTPWILSKDHIRTFFHKKILSEIKELEIFTCNSDEIRASAHSFRHYIATNIAIVSKDIETAQTALGHKYINMTERYISSNTSKETILLKMVEKFQKNEITGKFYLRLVDILTSKDTTSEKLIQVITTEMKLDEFFQKHGRKVDAGYCFSKQECSNWYACWDCSNFIITRNEINEAIKILAIQILELKNMKQCNDFSFDAPSIKRKFNLISCIIKRLTELGLTEEYIERMVLNCFNNKEITLGVIKSE